MCHSAGRYGLQQSGTITRGGRRVGEPAMVARLFVVTYSEQPSRQTDADHGIYRECFDEADVIAHLAANVIEVG